MAVNQEEAEKTERRLRPLYDAVDNGQNKKAIQLADKILKKQDDLQCARALKAIALLRMGRQEESVHQINSVLGSHPGDQASLQACTMYFKENTEYSKIADMYADASVRYPKNQEILTHLFMAYVRVGDYQKQQHTAIELHKAFPHSGPYYCWRVMSILMQATDPKNNVKASHLFLPLAEKLMDKYFAENEVDSEAEVRLYLMVLDRLNKIDKKLKILQGPPGDKIKNRDECFRLEVDCMVALQQWGKAVARLTELIRSKPDQWSNIKQYINYQIKRCKSLKTTEVPECGEKSVEDVGGRRGEVEVEGKCMRTNSLEEVVKEDRETIKCVGRGDGGCDELSASSSEQSTTLKVNPQEGDELIEGGCVKITNSDSEDYLSPLRDARDLMESLVVEEQHIHQLDVKPRYVLRGPFLGRMELVRQLYLNGMHQAIHFQTHLQNVLMDYFKIFGTKSCVFDDLNMYVDTFSKFDKDSVLVFIQQVQDLVKSEPVDFDCPEDLIKENIHRLGRHTNLIQLQRFMGCLPLSTDELLALCLRYHSEGLKLGRNLGSIVNHPSDFYAILACHIMMEQYENTRDLKILWDIIFLLEGARNSNPQISLLLMKLYGILGGNESITNLFEAVAIKHLQMETIGYMPMRYIQSMGTFGFANQLYKSGLRFYYGASKEFSEYIIQAYKNGTFTKIEEFVDCRDRLTHSFNFVNTLTEMNILEMIVSVHSISQAREFFTKEWIHKLPCSLRDYVSSLVDNRDLTVLDDWSPLAQRLSDIQVKASFDIECLWLRTRLSLVKSLGEAVSLASDRSKCREGEGSKGETSNHKLGLVAALVQKVEVYRSTLEQMDKHVGVLQLRETMKQGSQKRLPIQYPPPCLGYFFLQQGHGQIIFDMLRVTIKLVEGSEQLEDILRDVLGRVEAIRCRISGVPDKLIESLGRLVDHHPAPKDEETKVEEDGRGALMESALELDHPYDILIRSRIDLESYVLLLQTLSFVLLLCTVCTEILLPPSVKETKKKKKKKTMRSVSPHNPSPAQIQLHNFISEVHRMLSSLCKFFCPFPLPDNEEELTLRLRNLYVGERNGVEEESNLLKEKNTKCRVCGTILTSYDMSLRDTMQLASAKLSQASALIERLSSGQLEQP